MNARDHSRRVAVTTIVPPGSTKQTFAEITASVKTVSGLPFVAARRVLLANCRVCKTAVRDFAAVDMRDFKVRIEALAGRGRYNMNSCRDTNNPFAFMLSDRLSNGLPDLVKFIFRDFHTLEHHANSHFHMKLSDIFRVARRGQ